MDKFPSIYFNTPEFLRQVFPASIPVFDFIDETESCKLFIRFTRQEKVLRSPCKATFGGFEWQGDLNLDILINILQGIESKALELGLSKITITQSPACYFTQVENELLKSAYKTAGFEITYVDKNFHIPVDSELYSLKLHDRTAQRLRTQKNMGYSVQEAAPEAYPWFFEKVKENRFSKGRPLNQSLEEFIFATQQNPDFYKIYSVQNSGGDVLSFSVCTFLGKSLYTFYTVNLVEGEVHNPLYLLHEHLYQVSQDQAIPILDLGISTDKGVENEGLSNFKRQLRGIPTGKITWQKVLPTN